MSDAIAAGVLKKSGLPFHVRFLGADDLDAVLALQERILADLALTCSQNFIVPKSREKFALLQEGAGKMLGVFVQGALVAQCVMCMPTPEHPETGMDMVLPGKPEEVSIMQGGLVDPAMRGNGLLQTMTELWLSATEAAGRKHALGEIAVPNHYSWAVLLACGMVIVQSGTDPSDGCELFYAHKVIGSFHEPAGEVLSLPPVSGLAKVREKLAEGFAGIGWDGSSLLMASSGGWKAECAPAKRKNPFVWNAPAPRP